MKKPMLLHNPRCRKSREAIELLNKKKIDFEILLYMKDGLDKFTIEKIIQKLKINPLELVRTQEKFGK